MLAHCESDFEKQQQVSELKTAEEFIYFDGNVAALMTDDYFSLTPCQTTSTPTKLPAQAGKALWLQIVLGYKALSAPCRFRNSYPMEPLAEAVVDTSSPTTI